MKTKQEKVCTMCKEVKVFEEYYVNKTTKDGRGSRCKACILLISKQTYNEKKQGKYVKRVLDGKPKKQCSSCHVTKPLTEFEASVRNKDGYKSSCRFCLEKKEQKRVLDKRKKNKKLRELTDEEKIMFEKWDENKKTPYELRVALPSHLEFHRSQKIKSGKEKLKITDTREVDDCTVYTVNHAYEVLCFPLFMLVQNLEGNGKTDKMMKLALKSYIYNQQKTRTV